MCAMRPPCARAKGTGKIATIAPATMSSSAARHRRTCECVCLPYKREDSMLTERDLPYRQGQ